MSGVVKRFEASPYSFAEVREIETELGLSRQVATALVRRGYRSADQARAFLQASDRHDPFGFEGMEEAVETLAGAIDTGSRITVYGDFDADGVCSTALMVEAIRELGGTCDWFIPDRIADGYGLSRDAIGSLAERGTELIVTVDCGITAAEEISRCRELGIGILVTDHHRPGPEPPGCVHLHPELCGYPFAGLCGAGVAHKLAAALRAALGVGPERDRADLDLVALATVADIVPLLGENRRLVREGLEVAREGRRPGMKALIEASGCEPTGLREEDLGFRLGPRVNAAGRMHRADAGVELFTTGSAERAAEVAEELSRANAERRRVEREVEAMAEAERRQQAGGDRPGTAARHASALVLAGEGWHPGVIGIVASRLADRHHLPTVVISTDGDTGRGSARSVPGFDLLAAISDCGRHLVRYGGHEGAAGLTIETAEIDSFRAAFSARAAAELGDGPAIVTEAVDAMIGGREVGLELAEELQRLGPFGQGNPPVSLLVPGGRITEVRPMGEGRHARFNLRMGGHRAAGVCFGRSSFGVGEAERVDVAVRLEVNRYKGAIEPRLLLREVYPATTAAAGGEPEAELARGHEETVDPADFWHRFELELERGPGPRKPAPGEAFDRAREQIVHRSLPGTALAELASGGESVLVLTADAARRAESLAGAIAISRFGGAASVIACGRCPADCVAAAAAAAREGSAGILIADYEAAATVPGLVRGFRHVAVLDPPAFEVDLARAMDGSGYIHLIGGKDELVFAERVLAERYQLAPMLRSLYRDLRELEPGTGGEELLRALTGSGGRARSAELAARCSQVLEQVGLVRWSGAGDARLLGSVSSERIELGGSPAFAGFEAAHREGLEFLRRSRQPSNRQPS